MYDSPLNSDDKSQNDYRWNTLSNNERIQIKICILIQFDSVDWIFKVTETCCSRSGYVYERIHQCLFQFFRSNWIEKQQMPRITCCDFPACSNIPFRNDIARTFFDCEWNWYWRPLKASRFRFATSCRRRLRADAV